MGKFNTKAKEKTITTHQGGTGYEWPVEIELVLLMAAGLTAKYYQAEKAVIKQLDELIDKVARKDKYLLAQIIIYTRSVLGQRSITHYAAARMAQILAGEEWGKRFFSKRQRKGNDGGVVWRLDDIMEIAGAYMHVNGATELKLTNAMKKGFASALEGADPYELAKYKMQSSDIKLVDIVNLVHPKAEGETKEAIIALLKGELKEFDTRQSANTETGKQVAEAVKTGEVKKEDKERVLKEAKSKNYRDLIESNKMGYMDLIRNLRNIVKTDDTIIDTDAFKTMLTSRKLITQSLVFPHQIDLAFEVVLKEMSAPVVRKLAPLVAQAYEESVANVKELNMSGRTAVVIDTSASMYGGSYRPLVINGEKTNGRRMPMEKAALVGATLAKGLGADLYQFSDICKSIRYNPMDSIHSIANEVMRRKGEVGYGTYLSRVWETLAKSGRYERVFLLSDMQVADKAQVALKDFKRTHNINPYIYSIDLCGYGTSAVKPGDRVFPLGGYSAAIYETAKAYETDPKALLNEIKKIKF